MTSIWNTEEPYAYTFINTFTKTTLKAKKKGYFIKNHFFHNWFKVCGRLKRAGSIVSPTEVWSRPSLARLYICPSYPPLTLSRYARTPWEMKAISLTFWRKQSNCLKKLRQKLINTFYRAIFICSFFAIFYKV